MLLLLPDEENQGSERRILQGRGQHDQGTICQRKESEELDTATVAGADSRLP